MAEGNTIVPASKYEFDYLNGKFLYLSVGGNTTARIKFEGNGFAFIFGRFGYDSNILSMCVLHHDAENSVYATNFGTQAISASCVNHIVTLTFPQTYSAFYLIATVPVSVAI